MCLIDNDEQNCQPDKIVNKDNNFGVLRIPIYLFEASGLPRLLEFFALNSIYN